jgi:serine protease Do
MPAGKPYWLLTVILLALAIALGFAAALNWQERGVAASASHKKALREQIRQNEQFAAVFRQVFREAAEAVRPSVVGIKAYRSRFDRPGGSTDRRPDEMEEFRRHFPFLPTESTGSGVIVETDRGIAYILTNEHVVHGADKITVNLSDGREFHGQRRAEDEKTDLALITIEGHDFASAELGNSDELVVGDWILAIGNPFGLSHTVTTGIVSAKGRSDVRVIASRQAYEDFIQTDAAINPGNSGGPLVNLDGQVVGINTAIVSRNGGSQGVGFAIPINLAHKVYRQLRDKGRVSRGWLGVRIEQINKEEVALLGLETKGGVRVVGTFPGNPAAKAGLQEGDVIIKFGNRDIRTVEELRNTVADTPVSSEVAVVVVRDGKPLPLTVTLVEQPREVEELATVEGEKSLGLVVQELTPELAREFGYTGQQGVLVTDVAPRSRAAAAGIPPGALIQGIHQGTDHQYQVRSVKDFENGLKSISLGQTIGMTLRLPGTDQSIVATIE